MAEKLRAGNITKLSITTTANGAAFDGLAGADSVSLALFRMSDNGIVLSANGSDSSVTLDDGSTGVVSWQLTSPQTNGLNLGFYGVAVQSNTSGDIIEWVEENAIEIIRQIISNS